MSLQLYKASAGSGKTYTLAQKYLLLVIQQPANYQRILAITFTRKATAEMKGRILQELAALANGHSSKQLPDLIARLNQEGRVYTEAKIRQQARLALELLLGDYSRFNISTIDSFCQQVVRAFALETGLSYGYNIELDQPKVLSAVADDLLLLAGQDAATTKLMLDFALKQLEDNKRWDFRKQLVVLAGNLMKDEFESLRQYINTHPEADQRLDELKKRMMETAKAYEASLKGLGNDIMAKVATAGLSIDDFSNKSRGPIGYPVKLAKGVFEGPGPSAKKAANDPNAWFTKKRPANASVELAEALSRLTTEAIEVHQAESPRYATAKLIRKNAFGLGLMSKLLNLVQAYKRENNVQLMQDINDLLKVVIDGNDAPFIYEKVGTRYQHYFLDEFQDTSNMQWHNLAPLLQEGLAQGQESLIVGDVKQSIYRFRGGDWQLLGRRLADEIDPDTLQVNALDRNYRSTRTVIDFNNLLFEALPGKLIRFQNALVLDTMLERESLHYPELEALAKAMEESYAGAQQIFPPHKAGNPADENGLVQVRVYDKKATQNPAESGNEATTDEDEDPNDLVDAKLPLQELPLTIIELQRHGFVAADIAILVRTNKQGQAVANALQVVKAGQLGADNPDVVFDVISSDSLFLANATTVQLLIAAFRWLQAADDGLATTVLVGLWHQYQAVSGKGLMDLDVSTNQPTWVQDMPSLQQDQDWVDWAKKYLPARLVDSRLRMMQQSAYDVAEQLVDFFEIAVQASGEVAYVQGLLDVVLSYGRNNPNDIRSFLKWWDDEGNKQSLKIAGRQNAITIITLHKSKGLEFPVVLMPFVDWSLEPKSGATLFAASDPEALMGFPGLPLAYGNDLKDSLFAADHARELLQNSFDALNFLYVALTRACKVLKIWMPLPYNKKGTVTKTINALVIDVLRDKGILTDQHLEDGGLISLGNLADVFLEQQDNNNAITTIPLGMMIAGNTTNRMMVKADARKYLQTQTGIGQDEEGENYREKRIQIGLYVHQLLSRLQDVKDLRQEADKPYFAGDLSLEDKQALETMINKLMELPQMRQWFGLGIRALTEANILLPDGQLRRPDRIVLLPTETVVIDFKTGKANHAHKKQILGYMDHLSAMGHTNVTGHLVYLQDQLIVPVYAA